MATKALQPVDQYDAFYRDTCDQLEDSYNELARVRGALTEYLDIAESKDNQDRI